MWLRYQNGTDPAQAFRFQPIQLYEKDFTELETGRTLRKIGYSHTLGKWLTWDVLIGANELSYIQVGIVDVNPGYAFLREFWKAGRRWFSLSTAALEPAVADEQAGQLGYPAGTMGPVAAQFVGVIIEGGQSPEQWVEGSKHFPSYPLSLAAQYPLA
jgi:hypothetical protein